MISVPSLSRKILKMGEKFKLPAISHYPVCFWCQGTVPPHDPVDLTCLGKIDDVLPGIKHRGLALGPILPELSSLICIHV